MGLKKCQGCGKPARENIKQCTYCGALYFDETDFFDSPWLIFAIFSILVSVTFFFGNQFLNQLNIGVISARDFRNCTNDRITTAMKNHFHQSKYSIRNKVTVVDLKSKEYADKKNNAVVACKVEYLLSNQTTLVYVYQIKYLHGDYYYESKIVKDY